MRYLITCRAIPDDVLIREDAKNQTRHCCSCQNVQVRAVQPISFKLAMGILSRKKKKILTSGPNLVGSLGVQSSSSSETNYLRLTNYPLK
jgi:hypothetical protein